MSWTNLKGRHRTGVRSEFGIIVGVKRTAQAPAAPPEYFDQNDKVLWPVAFQIPERRRNRHGKRRKITIVYKEPKKRVLYVRTAKTRDGIMGGPNTYVFCPFNLLAANMRIAYAIFTDPTTTAGAIDWLKANNYTMFDGSTD